MLTHASTKSIVVVLLFTSFSENKSVMYILKRTFRLHNKSISGAHLAVKRIKSITLFPRCTSSDHCSFNSSFCYFSFCSCSTPLRMLFVIVPVLHHLLCPLRSYVSPIVSLPSSAFSKYNMLLVVYIKLSTSWE